MALKRLHLSTYNSEYLWAVVDEIHDPQVSEIVLPLLNDKNVQREINDTVLEANRKRTEAYNLEQKALRVLDEKVIYVQ